jgi:hypothetical protein
MKEKYKKTKCDCGGDLRYIVTESGLKVGVCWNCGNKFDIVSGKQLYEDSEGNLIDDQGKILEPNGWGEFKDWSDIKKNIE